MYLRHIFSHRFYIIRKRLFSWHLRKKDWIISAAFSSKLSDISRENFLPLDSLVEFRRNEARRSVIIEVQEQEMTILHSVCSRFGNIKNAFAFQPTKKKNLCIIEFEDETSLQNILQVAQTTGTELEEHALTPFLKFSANKLDPQTPNGEGDAVKADFETEVTQTSEEEMINHMVSNCNSISEQIQYLYDSQKMTEIGYRLRFLACRKIEWLLPSVLSHCIVRPFGSCVNTFGNRRCDVDMSIELSPLRNHQLSEDFHLSAQRKNVNLVTSDRGKANLRVLGDLLALYMPGIEKIQAIMTATVPIIKCRDSLTGLDCDISLNDSSFHMSEILYLLGCADYRVRPLVFCVRWWAKASNLMPKSEPWHWFTGFQLTLLVLFFLMNTRPAPVVPSLRTLQMTTPKGGNLPHSTSAFHVRDISRLPPSPNPQTLEELFVDFFEFYKNFNFSKHAISLVGGRTYAKPSYTSLYLQNPVEKALNVCKNISYEEIEEFQVRCAEAVVLLDRDSRRTEANCEDRAWGLPTLCQSRSSAPHKSYRSGNFDAVSLLHDVMVESNDVIKPTSNFQQIPQNPPQKKRRRRRDLRRAPELIF